MPLPGGGTEAGEGEARALLRGDAAAGGEPKHHIALGAGPLTRPKSYNTTLNPKTLALRPETLKTNRPSGVRASVTGEGGFLVRTYSLKPSP
eukprot:1078468-Pyramimonas_sp.AAC.2